jgi:hypothetical protein
MADLANKFDFFQVSLFKMNHFRNRSRSEDISGQAARRASIAKVNFRPV